MQDHAVFVFDDLDRNFEELRDDRRRLCICQRRMLQDLAAQLLVQDVGRSVLKETHEIGDEG